MKVELKATAKLVGVDIQKAAKTIRKNPLFKEEVHIEESLVGLEESLATYRVAEDTLRQYPKIRRHVLKEQRHILHHCIGVISRMLQGDSSVPGQYNENDIRLALKRVVRLMVDEAMRVSKKIDEEAFEIVVPFLTWRQRLALKHFPDAVDFIKTNTKNIYVPVPVRSFLRKHLPVRQFR